jgi:hypothetical protein
MENYESAKKNFETALTDDGNHLEAFFGLSRAGESLQKKAIS